MSPEMSSEKSTKKLIYMANQIGKFFASQGAAHVIDGTAHHIRQFWDPRMRAAIFAHLETGGAGLDPPVRQAIENLRNAGRKKRGFFFRRG